MGYTPKRLKIHEIRADIWECPPDHPLLRLTVVLLKHIIIILLHLFIILLDILLFVFFDC